MVDEMHKKFDLNKFLDMIENKPKSLEKYEFNKTLNLFQNSIFSYKTNLKT